MDTIISASFSISSFEPAACCFFSNYSSSSSSSLSSYSSTSLSLSSSSSFCLSSQNSVKPLNNLFDCILYKQTDEEIFSEKKRVMLFRNIMNEVLKKCFSSSYIFLFSSASYNDCIFPFASHFTSLLHKHKKMYPYNFSDILDICVYSLDTDKLNDNTNHNAFFSARNDEKKERIYMLTLEERKNNNNNDNYAEDKKKKLIKKKNLVKMHKSRLCVCLYRGVLCGNKFLPYFFNFSSDYMKNNFLNFSLFSFFSSLSSSSSLSCLSVSSSAYEICAQQKNNELKNLSLLSKRNGKNSFNNNANNVETNYIAEKNDEANRGENCSEEEKKKDIKKEKSKSQNNDLILFSSNKEENNDKEKKKSKKQCIITSEIAYLLCFYLNAEELGKFSLVCKSWYYICAVQHQPIWHELVLKKYGFKYGNYVLYTGQNDWRLLYAKANTFVKNMKNASPKEKIFKNLLLPGINGYEGSLAMTADCKLLLWENGQNIQCINVDEGKEVYKIAAPGIRDINSRPCLVNTKTKIFLHLNKQIYVFNLYDGTYICSLHIPELEGKEWAANDFSLDVSIRNQQLTFLTLNALYVFNCDTLKLLYKVVHREITSDVDTCNDIDFLWAGYRCVSGNQLKKRLISNNNISNDFDLETSCTKCFKDGLQITKCRHKSKHIVTWLKKKSSVIKIFDMRNGKELLELRGHENKILRARQAQNLYELEHYYLASLDLGGIIRIWDSSTINFNCIQILSTNSPCTFRLSFTSTHLMTMSETRPHRNVIVKIWEFNPFYQKKKTINKQNSSIKNQNNSFLSYMEDSSLNIENKNKNKNNKLLLLCERNEQIIYKNEDDEDDYDDNDAICLPSYIMDDSLNAYKNNNNDNHDRLFNDHTTSHISPTSSVCTHTLKEKNNETTSVSQKYSTNSRDECYVNLVSGRPFLYDKKYMEEKKNVNYLFSKICKKEEKKKNMKKNDNLNANVNTPTPSKEDEDNINSTCLFSSSLSTAFSNNSNYTLNIENEKQNAHYNGKNNTDKQANNYNMNEILKNDRLSSSSLHWSSSIRESRKKSKDRGNEKIAEEEEEKRKKDIFFSPSSSYSYITISEDEKTKNSKNIHKNIHPFNHQVEQNELLCLEENAHKVIRDIEKEREKVCPAASSSLLASAASSSSFLFSSSSSSSCLYSNSSFSFALYDTPCNMNSALAVDPFDLDPEIPSTLLLCKNPHIHSQQNVETITTTNKEEEEEEEICHERFFSKEKFNFNKQKSTLFDFSSFQKINANNFLHDDNKEGKISECYSTKNCNKNENNNNLFFASSSSLSSLSSLSSSFLSYSSSSSLHSSFSSPVLSASSSSLSFSYSSFSHSFSPSTSISINKSNQRGYDPREEFFSFSNIENNSNDYHADFNGNNNDQINMQSEKKNNNNNIITMQKENTTTPTTTNNNNNINSEDYEENNYYINSMQLRTFPSFISDFASASFSSFSVFSPPPSISSSCLCSSPSCLSSFSSCLCSSPSCLSSSSSCLCSSPSCLSSSSPRLSSSSSFLSSSSSFLSSSSSFLSSSSSCLCSSSSCLASSPSCLSSSSSSCLCSSSSSSCLCSSSSSSCLCSSSFSSCLCSSSSSPLSSSPSSPLSSFSSSNLSSFSSSTLSSCSPSINGRFPLTSCSSSISIDGSSFLCKNKTAKKKILKSSPVLKEMNTFILPDASYFTDFIDNQLLGAWMCLSSTGFHFTATLSDWEVYDCIHLSPFNFKNKNYTQHKNNRVSNHINNDYRCSQSRTTTLNNNHVNNNHNNNNDDYTNNHIGVYNNSNNYNNSNHDHNNNNNNNNNNRNNNHDNNNINHDHNNNNNSNNNNNNDNDNDDNNNNNNNNSNNIFSVSNSSSSSSSSFSFSSLTPPAAPLNSSYNFFPSSECIALKNKHTWKMQCRGDVWTLLDWKCLGIQSNGDVHVYDFCALPVDKTFFYCSNFDQKIM